MKTCFFIGHREASADMAARLEKTIEIHIEEYGVDDIVVGQYGNFDLMAAKAVIKAKARHPDIRLTILLPYHPTLRKFELPDGCDGTFYPPGMENIPYRFAIIKANQYMIKHSDYIIAYVWHPASNARELLEFAEKQKDLIITII